MRKRIDLIFVLLLTTIVSFADVAVTLRSGEIVFGNIIFQTEDILLLKTESGQRFQYQMSEVADIQDGLVTNQSEETKKETTKKKVGISLHIAGGGGLLPSYHSGGSMSADVFVGACNVFDKHIFIGGGIGYEAFFMPAANNQDITTYSFIPLQIRFSTPFMQTRHAPAIGMSVGYGFSPKGIEKSGLAASLDFGYRCQISEKNALFAGLTAAIQQSKIDEYTETIEKQEYKFSSIQSLWKIGAKVAIQF